MPSGRIAEVLLRYRIENNSLNQTVAGTHKLQRSLESVRASTLEAFKDVPKSVEKRHASFEDANKNLERTARLAEVVGGNIRAAFSSDTSNRLQAIANANREIKDSSLQAVDALEREARTLTQVASQPLDRKGLREAQGDLSTSFGTLASVANLSPSHPLLPPFSVHQQVASTDGQVHQPIQCIGLLDEC